MFVGLTVLLGVASLVTISTLSGSGSELGSSEFDAEASVVQLFAWAAAFGWTSHIGFSFEEASVSGGAGVTGPFGFWALLALVALVVGTRRLTRRFRPASRRSLYAQTAVAVCACLIVLLVVGLVGRFSESGATVSALGFWPVLRVLLLVAVALLGGIALAVPRGDRVEAMLGPSASRRWASVGVAADAAVWHVAAWLVIGIVVGFFAAIVIREDLPFGLSLAFLPTVGPLLAAIGHLGAVQVDASGQQDALGFLPAELGQQVSVALWTEETPWLAWLLPVVAALVILALAARMTLLRRPGANIDLRHMAVTAACFVVVWFVVVRVLGVVSSGVSFAYESEGGEGSLSLGPTWWTFVLLLLTGVGIELAHAFVGSQLVQRLPSSALRVLAPRPHPEWAPYLGGHVAAGHPHTGEASAVVLGPEGRTATQQGSVSDDDEPTVETPPAAPAGAWGAAVPGPGGGTWGQPRPVSRRTKVVIGSLAGAVVLVGVGWFVLDQVDDRYFGPERVALDYASAVVDGRAEDAVEIGRMNIANDDRLLLTDEVYAGASNRPGSAEVVDVTESEDGESATVDVEFEQNGRRYTRTLVAERTGSTMLVFSDWQLQLVTPATAGITVMADSVQVNGTTVKVAEVARPDDEQVHPVATAGDQPSGYVLNLPALPGTYEFDIPSTKYTEAAPVEVRVPAGPAGGDVAGSGAARTLVATPNQEFEDEVNSQVASTIDDCLKDYGANLPCPFDSRYLDDEDMSTPSFSIDQYPTLVPGSVETIPPGTQVSLDLEGDPTVTETATCQNDDTFLCDKGESDETTRDVSTYGWTVTVTGDEVEVTYSDGPTF